MTHPLLRRLAALAEDDDLGDLTQLFAAPGRNTLTSKLPARPTEALPIVINVADAESARALGDSLLVTARAKFERAAMGPTDESGGTADELVAAPAAPAPTTPAAAGRQPTAAMRPARPIDKVRLQAKQKAAFGEAASIQRRPDGKVKLEHGGGVPAIAGAKPATALPAIATSPAAERAFKAVGIEPAKPQRAVEDPFAMHLLPARPTAAATEAAAAPATAAALPGFERAPGFGPAAAAADPVAAVDPMSTTPRGSATDEAPSEAGWPAFDDLFERVDFGGAGDAAGLEEEAPGVEAEAAEEPEPAFRAATPAGGRPTSRARARMAEASNDVPRAGAARPGRATELRAAKDDEAPDVRGAKPDRTSGFRATGTGHTPALRTAKPEHTPTAKADDAPAFRATKAEHAPTFRAVKADPAPELRTSGPEQAPILSAAAADQAPNLRAAGPDQAPSLRAAGPDQAPNLRAAGPDQTTAPASHPAKPDAAPAWRAAKPDDGQASTDDEKSPKFHPTGDGPHRLQAGHTDDAKDAKHARRGDDTDAKDGASTEGRGKYAKAPGRGKAGPVEDEASSPLDPYFDRDTPFSKPSGGPAPSGPGPGRAPGPGGATKPGGSAKPAGPAPGSGGGGAADLEAQKQAVKAQAERKRAEVTELHQHTAATASAQAQAERQTKFEAAKSEAQAEKARLDAERDAAKAEAQAERESKEVTRAGLEEEIAAAETQEVTELTSGKDSALQELQASLDNQKARLTTEHTALMAKVDAELATSEQESATKLGEKAEALRTNMETELKKLDTDNETRKAKNITTAETQRDAFLEEGRRQEKDARERGETDAAAVKDAAEVSATAAIEEARTRGLAAQNAALAAAEQIADPAEKEKKKGTAVLAFNEALLAGTNKAIQLRTQAAVSADTIRTKAMELADGMKTKAEEKAKSLVSDAKQLNTTLDAELALAKGNAGVKLNSDLGALEGERQKMLAQLRTNAETQRTTAKTKLDADTAKIDTDRDAATKDLETKLEADLTAAKDKAAKARADLASHSDSDLAAAAEEVRRTTAEIDRASEDAEKRNGETVAKVEASVTARTTVGISDMQRVAAETLISIDVEADAMCHSLDERGKLMEAQQDAAAKATEEGLAKRQTAIEQELAKKIESRKAEIGDEAIEEQEKLREAKLDSLDETAQALDKELDHATDPNRDRAAEDEAAKAQKAEADKLAAQMADELDDTFVDEDAVLDMMSGKTPAQVAALKAAYKERTGKDLDGDLGGAMDDDEMKMAKAQMSGDKLTQRLARLEYESEEWLTDESKMAAAMDGLSAAEKTELAKRFEQRTGDDLSETLDDELDADQRAKVGEVKDGQEVYDKDKGKAKLAELRKDSKLTPEQDKAAAKAAADIRAGMTQLIGTDEDAILNALKGKSPEEIAAIKAHFAAQGWGDMESSVEKAMGGLIDSDDDMKLAKARLSGDPVVAAAAQLEVAMDGAGTDTDAVHEALEGITDPEQRRKVAAEYEARTGCKLDDDVKGELSGYDARLADAMMIDDPVKRASAIAANRLDEAANGNFISEATGVRIPSILIGGVTAHSAFTDEKKMYAELEKIKDPAVRAQLEKDYQELTGKSLRSDMADSLGGTEDNARYDAVTAYLDGDMEGARAARIRAGADSLWGTDEKEIYAQLEGLSPAEREAVRAKIVTQTRSEDNPNGQTLDNILEDELSDEQLDKATELAKTGKCSPATEIRNALNDIGTDDAALTKALAGKSKAEIDAMAKDYNARYGKDGDEFFADIRGENLGGREDKLLELQITKGEPQTDAEKLERIKDLHEIERGDGNFFTDALRGDAGKDMDDQLAEAKRLEKKLKDGTLSADDKQALTDVTNYHANSVDNYRKAQEDVVSVMNTVSDAVYATNPILAATQRIFNKYMVLEDNYGAGEIIKDVGVEAVKLGVQALTAVIGGGQFMQGLGGLGKEVVMGAFKGMLDGLVEGAFDEAAIRDLGDYFKGMLAKGATGAATGAAEALAEAAVDGAVGKLLSQFSADTEGKARLLGALEELLKGAGGVAIDPDTYEKRWEDTAKSAVPGIIKDMVGGQQKGADAYNKSLTKEFADAAREKHKNAPEDVREKAIQEAIAEGQRVDELWGKEAAQAEADAKAKARAEGKSQGEVERAGADARRATEESHKAAHRKNERERQSNTNDPAPDPEPYTPPPPPPPPPPAPAPPAAENTDEAIDRANKAREEALDNHATPEEADQAYADGLSGQPPRPLPPRAPSAPSETDVKVNRAQRAHDEAIANGATPEEANQAYVDALLFL